MLNSMNLGCFGLLVVLLHVNGLVWETPTPPSMFECLEERRQIENLAETPADVIFPTCFSKYFWETIRERYHVYNVTVNQLNWIRSLDREMHIKMRAGVKPIAVRKDIRSMSYDERCAFFKALNDLKSDTSIEPNMYDVFGRLHKSINLRSSHFGISFLTWHRVFLYYFELALQRKNPFVALAYWDTTLDYNMKNSLDSVMFTPDFYGTSNGVVDSGPFGHWVTDNGGQIVRNSGCPGMLISNERVKYFCKNPTVLSHAQIVESSSIAKVKDTIEGVHNGVHSFVSGSLGSLEDSTDDPFFYAHHAFIDYMWEIFLRKQRKNNINPVKDYYPFGGPSHGLLRFLDGLPWVTNLDGMSSLFTDQFYTYEDRPRCPSCNGSPFLTCCDGECVSKTKHEALPYLPKYAASLNRQSQNAYSSRHAGNMGLPGHAFSHAGSLSNMNQNPFNLSLSDQVTFPNVILDRTFQSTLQDPTIFDPPRNSFRLDGEQDENQWAFAPVRVVVKPERFYPRPFSAATFPKCPRYDGLNIIKVEIQSVGLSYRGNHRSRVIALTDVPVTEGYTVTAFKRPDFSPVRFAVVASDVYGRACKTMCHSGGTSHHCSSFFEASSIAPEKYYRTRSEALQAVNQWNNQKNHHNECIYITFVCDSGIEWPWIR